MYENPYLQNPYLQQRFYQQPQQYQQMQQLQQPTQQIQQPQFQSQQLPQLIGRPVNQVEEITANDVPMNAPYALFPKSDLSEIYLKSWTANGTIQTIAFKPVQMNQADNSLRNQSELKIGLTEDVTQALMSQFEELKNKIDRLEQSMSGSSGTVRTKSKASTVKKDGESE
jgi:hypothetical protein